MISKVSRKLIKTEVTNNDLHLVPLLFCTFLINQLPHCYTKSKTIFLIGRFLSWPKADSC